MKYQSMFCSTADGEQLHIMHISKAGQQGMPVLMIHGMVEDGRIFYHKSGKGLGSYLAQQGFDVYVADRRGVGASTPKITEASTHGQTETIVEDIPRLIEFVLQASGSKKLGLVAHSWGGVNVNAALARRTDLIDKVIASVYFASKRTVRVRNLERYFKISLIWNRMSQSLAKRKGYLPAVKYKLGSENETVKTHRQCVEWVQNKKWVDSDDGFDYGQSLKTVKLPPTLYYAAVRDFSMGHRSDVKNFMIESGPHESHYCLLSKKAGNKLDYDHINLLTAPECVDDHFSEVIAWFKKHLNY